MEAPSSDNGPKYSCSTSVTPWVSNRLLSALSSNEQGHNSPEGAPNTGCGRRTSRVWKYFGMLDNFRYMCKLCSFIGSYTNTTNMRKHIQYHHPESFQDILNHTLPKFVSQRGGCGAFLERTTPAAATGLKTKSENPLELEAALTSNSPYQNPQTLQLQSLYLDWESVEHSSYNRPPQYLQDGKQHALPQQLTEYAQPPTLIPIGASQFPADLSRSALAANYNNS